MDDVECILLDIEGTICPISFVKDTLFPYFLHHIQALLNTHFNNPSTLPDLGPYISAFPAHQRTDAETLLHHLEDLVARDVKAADLKALQGYVWARGYAEGELVTGMFGDVVPRLRVWAADGGGEEGKGGKRKKKVVVYSSGSVEAQKLLFGRVVVLSAEGESEMGGLKRKRGVGDGEVVAVAVADAVAVAGSAPGSADVEETSEAPAKKRILSLQRDPLPETADEQRSDKPVTDNNIPTSDDKPIEEAAAVGRPAVEGENIVTESSKPETEALDLRPLITAWFDTTNAGPKTVAESYVKIAASLDIPIAKILFLTDNVREVDAALEAGMQSILVMRPGNAAVEESDRIRLRVISCFDELETALEKEGHDGDAAGTVSSAAVESAGPVVASADVEPAEPSETIAEGEVE